MDRAVKTKPELSEKSLHHWRMLESFQAVVEQVFSRHGLPSTLEDPQRRLTHTRYLSLFLFGLFNPVVESMRGLCSASALPRVQREICGAKVSLGSFSEMQHVLDPALLYEVFQELSAQAQAKGLEDPRLAQLQLIAQDGSLWSALPRMAWAEYGVGCKGEAKGVRLHLRFHVVEDKPLAAKITVGKGCERQALRELCVAGQTNVGDRYYGEDYQLFADIDRAQGFFVFRIKDNAVIHVEEELPVSAADAAAGVVRHRWVRLGAHAAQRSIRLRLVEIQSADQHLFLVTNLSLAQAPAELVGLIYRRRWKIELFFRWIKCLLGCRHFFAESPAGVAIQLYLALIASLLLQSYSGRRPNKRLLEMIQFYLLGWATLEDLRTLMETQTAREKTAKRQ